MHAVYWVITHPVNKLWMKDTRLQGVAGGVLSLDPNRSCRRVCPELRRPLRRYDTRAFNEGKVKPFRGRIPENTTPTRFEDFAGELARGYLTA